MINILNIRKAYIMTYVFEIYRRVCNLFFFILSSKNERNLINECSKLEFCTTPKYNLWNTLSLFKKVTKNRSIKHNFVECGVWKGIYLVFLQKLIETYNMENFKIYGFDTFEGMSLPTKEDKTKHGTSMLDRYNLSKIDDKTSNWNFTEIDKVKDNYYQNTKKNNNLILVKGKVEDTLIDKQNIPDEISILKLDTCLYTGTKIELDILFPKVKKYGIVIIDNYFNYKGVKQATDEFFIKKKLDIKYSKVSNRVVIYK
jgi:O-methyltransferase